MSTTIKKKNNNEKGVPQRNASFIMYARNAFLFLDAEEVAKAVEVEYK